MTASGSDMPISPGAYDPQLEQQHLEKAKRRRKDSTDIPRIKLFSVLGVLSVLWVAVISHLVKWVGNALYFIFWQTRVAFGLAAGGNPAYTWDNKDFWDRLPIHVMNGFRWIIAVAIGLAVLALVLFLMRHIRGSARTVLTKLVIAVVLAVGISLYASFQLATYRVHWFSSQVTPLWWITWRHDIRDVGISLFATIVVLFMFSKPKYPLDDAPSLRVYLTSIPKGLAAALVPISLLGVLAWQLPWVMQHGWQIPARFGVLASEVNGFIEAGTWITVLMGIAGGFAAKFFITRIADDVQWFVAERSAEKIQARRTGERGGLAGLTDQAFAGTALRSDRIIGTPAHVKRVEWILASRPDIPARPTLLTRFLTGAAVAALPLAAFGAWLTLAGPAAVH